MDNFKEYRFQVTYAVLDTGTGLAGWKTKPIKEMKVANGFISEVITDDDMTITIDRVAAFIQEFTGMFDKVGEPINGGDILETDDGKLLPVSWLNGGFCIVTDENADATYFTQQNVLTLKKVGDVFRNEALILKKVDEKVFEQPKE